MFIIDGHAHIFPDKIAEKASENIGGFYGIQMKYNGTIATLLELGCNCGIDKHLVHSVATVPEQVVSVNNFIAKSVADYPDRLIGFASLHPDMADVEAEVERVIKIGLKGIKLHPDFQRFFIDENRMDRIYAAIAGKLPLLIHTGDHRYDFSSPKRVIPVLDRFPDLDMICAHFGGWSQWDEAQLFLKDRRIWVDTCSTLPFVSTQKALQLLEGFGEDRVIFGCDYPMWNPGDELAILNSLGLTIQFKEKMFYKNLCSLLGL